jgi:ankyrin repeat protein
VTTSGRVRKPQSIQRAFRRLKTMSGTAPEQVNSVSVLSDPSIHTVGSSVHPSDEQMLQTSLASGILEQQTGGLALHQNLDRDSLSPESALLGLVEAASNFNPARAARPASRSDDYMLSGLNSDYNFALNCQWQTPLFTAGGLDMFGMDLDPTLSGNWEFPTNSNASHVGVNLSGSTSPNLAFDLYLNGNHFSGVDLENTQLDHRVSQTVVTTSPPGALSGFLSSAQLLSQNGNVEGEILDSCLPSGITEQWMNRLPFEKFEEYLNSRHIAFNQSEVSVQQQVGASLSSSFAIRSLANSLYPASQTMLQSPGSQNPLQNLEKLIPGDNTAIVSQQHMTETRLVRTLLFSMMNGFAGLNHIPMEDILKAMGHFSTSKLLLQILQEGPPFTSRTLGDNMFRAAIEAKDQHTVQVLVERRLVDVNDTVCFFQNKRYTPVERAASLQALGIVRILAEAGADVNKTHGDDHLPGALRKLLDAAHKPNYRERCAGTATPRLISTLYFLIEKGSKIDPPLLGNFLGYFKNKNEVACLISRSIPSVDHQLFFKHEGEDKPNAAHSSLVGRTAEELDDNTATTIVQNMLHLCERSGCSKCPERWPKTIEYAAIEGAKRGHFKLVQLLVRHAQSTTKILSAAIRSRNNALIRFILDSDTKPELDPQAHSLSQLPSSYRGPHQVQSSLDREQIYDMLPTTPLAEAVRTGNVDLITLLEKSGAASIPMTEDRLEALILAAAEAGNMPYMERLLKIACSSSHKFRPHSFAVCLALENGHDEVAKILLSAGAEVAITRQLWDRLLQDAGFWERPSPLGVALTQKRHPALVRAILSADIGAVHDRDVADVDSWFDTSILLDIAFVFPDLRLSSSLGSKPSPLLQICARCMETHNLPFFKILLEVIPVPVFGLEECLSIAIEAGHDEMVDLLLQMGASPFNSIVLKSAISQHTHMLHLLFRKDRKQRTGPKCIGAYILKFVMAEGPGNAGVLNSLLDMGLVNLIAPESCREEYKFDTEEWFTPLGLAIVGCEGYCKTNLVAVDQLLQAGSDPDRPARVLTDRGRISETALMLAVETGREDVVQLLLRNKADVNKKPDLSIKRTPLQYAAEKGNLDMVRLLLRYGADVNCEPAIRSGGTALQLAAISGNCNLAGELLNRGAQLHALPSKVNGRWPLEGAAEHGRLDMIEFLWNAREISLDGAGFQRRQCLRAMDFARSNGHLGCRDLVAALSGIPVDALDSEDYGVPWLAY